ncbi:hypothetical protein PIIN_08873 [Serendipita indica DSM 11827]|uniref:Uncharacterized protein n=1 Tax=Serendipita indica (strain DSM 11827) TaxID=1109443 RepID=G4TUB0_SERID|nr:hypothetical protein PIIN_08873 [Serendipita indica DSM 11827]
MYLDSTKRSSTCAIRQPVLRESAQDHRRERCPLATCQPSELPHTHAGPKVVGAPITFTGSDGCAFLTFFPRLEQCFAAAGITGGDRVEHIPRYMAQSWRASLHGETRSKVQDLELKW